MRSRSELQVLLILGRRELFRRTLWSARGLAVAAGVVLALAAGRLSGADAVIEWNRVMLDCIRADNSPPTLASRNLAILQVAIYDAVNSVEKTHQPYRFQLTSPEGASSEAAAVGAGYAVMGVLYPGYRSWFDDLYQHYWTNWPATAAVSDGLSLGRLIGALTVEGRSDDGSATQITYIPREEPGQWRRTPPFYRPPVDPQWGMMDTFCLEQVGPFVPPGPPPLSSPEYAADLNTVLLLGRSTSVARTAEQSQIAVFWSDFSYTATPPGHWQEIAATIAMSRSNTLAGNARLFALLSLAQADAAVVVWESKYRDNFWRPVTAIQRADEDGNPGTTADAGWTSFLNTPSFPEYVSGHSTFSAASAAVLAGFFGTDDMNFTVGSDSLPAVMRSFQKLSDCADEVGASRIYGGIHFPSANRDGKTCGKRIGDHIVTNFLLPENRLPGMLVDRPNPSSVRLTVHGHIGFNYVLETTADFSHWTPVLTNQARAGGWHFEVSNLSPGMANFFRVRSEQ